MGTCSDWGHEEDAMESLPTALSFPRTRESIAGTRIPSRSPWVLSLFLSVALGALPCPAAFEFFEPVQPPRAFQTMVHRGMMRQAPENTAPAIELAIRDGIEWVEVDVRLSADRKHILFHDSNLDGKTNGKGPLKEKTLEELLSLDAGSPFAPRFAGTRLLSLKECLALSKGRINLYLDCKEIDPELLVSEVLALCPQHFPRCPPEGRRLHHGTGAAGHDRSLPLRLPAADPDPGRWPAGPS